MDLKIRHADLTGMQLMGIALASGAAILWGMTDPLAALSARQLTTSRATYFSQFVGLIALAFLVVFFCWFQPAILAKLSLQSVLVGVVTGIFASIGYFALYRALEIGPVAITSPLSSTSTVATLILSILILQEQITFREGLAIGAVILGILLVSTKYRDMLTLFRQRPGKILISKGVLWAYVAIVTFGLMDFGIGASTPFYGWFIPVLWTRLFSMLIFSFILCWKWSHKKRAPRSIMAYMLTMKRSTRGLLLAGFAGILENSALLVFGMATQIIKPGMTTAISSNYSLVAIVFGVVVFHERLNILQFLGIVLVICGITSIALFRV